MADQADLFGFHDMRPKMSLRKVITKERMEEVKKLLEQKDGKGAAQVLREIRYGLENIERRISNGTADCVGKSTKTNKRGGRPNRQI